MMRRMRERKRPPEHGTVSAYRNHGCRCPECCVAGAVDNERLADNLGSGHWKRDEESVQRMSRRSARTASRRNATSRDAASHHGQQWTGPELEVAAREDLAVEQVAAQLGRTISAVYGARRRLRHEPKWTQVVGL